MLQLHIPNPVDFIKSLLGEIPSDPSPSHFMSHDIVMSNLTLNVSCSRNILTLYSVRTFYSALQPALFTHACNREITKYVLDNCIQPLFCIEVSIGALIIHVHRPQLSAFFSPGLDLPFDIDLSNLGRDFIAPVQKTLDDVENQLKQVLASLVPLDPLASLTVGSGSPGTLIPSTSRSHRA